VSHTPAAHLARLKVEHPNWTISTAPGRLDGWVAEKPDGKGGAESIYAEHLARLEIELTEADSPWS
jgi:hypothetical protein